MVECVALEKRSTRKGTVGSNPTLFAKKEAPRPAQQAGFSFVDSVSQVSGAAIVQPMTRFAWTPETITWQETAPDGTRYALLEGVREAGTFTYAFFLPAGFWDEAHWHSTDARVFVMQGELRLGYGDRLDKEAATSYPAGSALLVPAEHRHYDGAEVDTLILGVASGSWFTRYVDSANQGSAGTV